MPTPRDQHDTMLLLNEYLPTTYSLIKDVAKYNNKIIQSYERKYNQIKKEIELKGEYIGQSTIFDLLWDANERIQRKKEFLLFIDNLVLKIISNVDESKINQVRKICYRMISNFSNDQSQYTRCLAELCVLGKIISSKKFTLVQIEEKLESGRPFDFLFKSGNKNTYVEVGSIDFEIDRIDSEVSFRKFLTHRLETKINKKMLGITKEQFDFLFVSVLWGDIKKLFRFKDVFKSFKEYKFLSPFMIISEYVSPKYDIFYTFEPVTTFFRRNKEIEDRNKAI